MSKNNFNIRPGVYVVPNFKRIDCTVKVSNADAIALYLNKDFPFITLKEGGVHLLKKERLNAKQVCQLILRSKSVEEVELLVEVNGAEIVKKIAITKIESFV